MITKSIYCWRELNALSTHVLVARTRLLRALLKVVLNKLTRVTFWLKEEEFPTNQLVHFRDHWSPISQV